MYKLQLAYESIREDESADCKFEVCQYFEAYFDHNFPFRPLLSFIQDCMRATESHVELVLPDYVEFEDFVTGSFELGTRRIFVYFEHSLAYVSFASNYRDDLVLLIEASEGQVFQHQGYELDNAS